MCLLSDPARGSRIRLARSSGDLQSSGQRRETERKARDILIDAFAGDVVDRIKIPAVRENLHDVIHRRLEAERNTVESA